MALTNGKQFSGEPLIFLQPRSVKKGEDGKNVKVDPHFEISRVGADGKIALSTETCTEVSGSIIRVDFKNREWNNQINKHAIFYVKDGNDTYHIDFTYRLASRSLFNAILSLTSADNLSIGIYESKKGYETFSLRQNDEIIKWKYTLEEQPQAEEITNKAGTKKITDFSEVDQFFEDVLREWVDNLGIATDKAKETEEKAPAAAPAKTPAPAKTAAPAAKTPAPAAKTKVTAPAPVAEPAGTAEDDSDSVPF